MAQIKEAMPGWGKVLSYALPAAGGVGLGAALPSLLKKKTPTFSEEEKQQFARHGIDPKSLGFYRTLGNLMKGMRMQQQFLDMALKGGTVAPPPAESENAGLEQYA
jgi:hypothetical protein